MRLPPFRIGRPALAALALSAACAAPVHGQLVIVPGPNNPDPTAAVGSRLGQGALAGCYHSSGGPAIPGHVSMNFHPGETRDGGCTTDCGITTCYEFACQAGLPGSWSRQVVSVTGTSSCGGDGDGPGDGDSPGSEGPTGGEAPGDGTGDSPGTDGWGGW